MSGKVNQDPGDIAQASRAFLGANLRWQHV
jgi:hypothetical protein